MPRSALLAQPVEMKLKVKRNNILRIAFVSLTFLASFGLSLYFLYAPVVTGTCPIPPKRDRRGQGAQYKMKLPCREAPTVRGASLSFPVSYSGLRNVFYDSGVKVIPNQY